MADSVLDVDAMLAPIGENGAGGDLRQDKSSSSIYQQLRDFRSEARAEERARDSDPATASGVPDGWRKVRSLAAEALLNSSKDFEIAGWLTEALVRLEGLAGFSAGVRLLTGLLQHHWEAAHPQPDEDGLEGRWAPIGGLSGGDNDGTAMQPLRRLMLFRGPSGEAFSLYQFEASEQTAGLSDEEIKSQRYAQGVIPLDKMLAEASFGPARANLTANATLAAAARADWQALRDQMEARFVQQEPPKVPPRVPPTRRLAELLDRMVEVARRLAGDAGGVPGAVEAGGTPAGFTGSEAPAPASAAGFAVPSLASREQALRTLEQLAGFFQKSEPHSFLAYTLADAARRGRMSLPELLAEVMQDDGARTAMLTALGIRPNAMDASE